VPVIVTVSPNVAFVGANDAMVGGGGVVYVNPARENVPSVGLVTLMLPVSPVPTIAVIVVGETTVKEAAGIPPKLTAVIPIKLSPVIVTVSANVALVGLKDVIAGGGIIVFLSTETVRLPKFATAISGLPSPSKSPIDKPWGIKPVGNSTLESNEIAPPEQVFFDNETTPYK
jgi:hypothetical protein